MTRDSKPRVRPGSSLRLEIHLSNFFYSTLRLTCAEEGELIRMLIAEAALDSIPATNNENVQRAFDQRDEYRRIRGGFGREAVPLETRKRVFERDGRRCGYCGSPIEWADYHCDHVEPVSKGGSNHESNLKASCRPCNLSKAAKPLSDWLQ